MGIIAVMAMGVYFTVNGTMNQKDDLLYQNIEALSAGEQDGYRNARNQYCSSPPDVQGCVDAPLRNCANTVFCIR